MKILRKTAAALLAAVMAIILVSCGGSGGDDPAQPKDPYADVPGFYAADLEEAFADELNGKSEEYRFWLLTVYRALGYRYDISVNEDMTGTFYTGTADDSVHLDLTFDFEAGEAKDEDGYVYSLEYSGKNIIFNGVKFCPAAGPTEPAWPFENIYKVGDNPAGSFFIPLSWNFSESGDFELEAYGEENNYIVYAYAYEEEQWEDDETGDFDSVEAFTESYAVLNRTEYEDSIVSDEAYEYEIDGCYAVREDMKFDDDSTYTVIGYRDTDDTYHIIVLQTYGEEALGYYEDFVSLISGSYRSDYHQDF